MTLDKNESREAPLIVLFIAGLGNGGAERVFLNLFQELRARGYRISLLVAARKGALALKVKDVEFLHSRFALSSLFRYNAYIAENQPAVVMSTLSSAIFISGLSKRLFQHKSVTPALIYRIANVYQKPRSIMGYLHVFMQRFALAQADAIVANSHATLNSIFSQIGEDLRKLPAEVIGNPVLPNNYTEIRSAARQASATVRGGADRPSHLVVIGRLVYQKRIDHAIKVFALIERRLQNSKLTILGDGPLKKELVGLAQEYRLGKKIQFISFSSDVPGLLASADCMISVSRYEGFGNVLVEGLAYCANLVAYKNSGGSDEILPATKATLVEDGDIAAMAEAVLGVLDQPDRSGLCSDAYLDNFTAAKTGDRYIEFIKANSKIAKSSV